MALRTAHPIPNAPQINQRENHKKDKRHSPGATDFLSRGSLRNWPDVIDAVYTEPPQGQADGAYGKKEHAQATPYMPRIDLSQSRHHTKDKGQDWRSPSLIGV